ATVAVCRWKVDPSNPRRGIALSDAMRCCPTGNRFVAPRLWGKEELQAERSTGSAAACPQIAYAQIHPRHRGGPDRRAHPASGRARRLARRDPLVLDQQGLAYLSQGG